MTASVISIGELPVRMTRAAGAALLSQHFFPVSPRTLERWPVTTRTVNGKALVETAELIAVAKAKLDAAPPIAGGCKAAA